MNSTRILYLVPDLFGPPSGIARYCRMVCRALAEAKSNLKIISLIDSPSVASDVAAAFPTISYRACGRSRATFIRSAIHATLAWHPQLILIGHPNLAPLGLFLARLTKTPYVVFMYGVDVWGPLSPTRRKALQQANQLISISQFTAKKAVEANCLAFNNIRTLYNCVDPDLETPVLSPKESSHQSMLTVARILKPDQYKGHDLVIRAMPALLKRFPDLKYNIVGTGEGRPEIEALAIKEGVDYAVHFHGVVSDQTMSDLYKNASLFVMPSRREGFGFVFIEAMSQGTPAIGGNLDATPEVIVDRKTGYIIDPTSVESLVLAASRLLEDASLRSHMGEAAVRHVKHKFGFESFKQQLFAHLSEVKS